MHTSTGSPPTSCALAALGPWAGSRDLGRSIYIERDLDIEIEISIDAY